MTSLTSFKINLSVVLFFFCLNANGQKNSVKELKVSKIEKEITVDGILSLSEWEEVPVIENFIQFSPVNGVSSEYRTTVRVAYTPNSVVFGIMMYDTNPNRIYSTMSKRDNISNSDYFSILIDPYNSGNSGLEYSVSSSGTQSDAKINKSSKDYTWNSIWESEVKINDAGWSAEISIPFSQLRFSNKKESIWGINFFRFVNSTNELSSWNFVDINQNEKISSNGYLTGIKNIPSPLRLSLSPYFASHYEKVTNRPGIFSFRGGLDLKLGLSESFTLDMMLVPDFGQVQSDDEILNLSPYEVKYNENRQFFTESSELFNRSGVFYSRRIGNTPMYKNKVVNSLLTDEIITDNPRETRIINATKVSGRNSMGLGIGILNAMTNETYAMVTDTVSGESRSILTQPFTNYNMIVLDKNLPNESYVNFFNTNVYASDAKYTANVSGTKFEVRDSKRTYNIVGRGVISQIYQPNSDDLIGFSESLNFGKIKGRYKWSYEHKIESNNYNINDLGYLRRNNEMSNSYKVSFKSDKPRSKTLHRCAYIKFNHFMQYKPMLFSDFTVDYNMHLTFTNYSNIAFRGTISPGYSYDYYEPRVMGMKLRRQSYGNSKIMFYTDARKTLSFRTDFKYESEFGKGDRYGYEVYLKPSLRLGKNLSANFSLRWKEISNELGYAGRNNEGNITTVFIGKRDRTIVENIFNTDYVFNTSSSIALRARYYWSIVNYKEFFELDGKGKCFPSKNYTKLIDINNRKLNLDLVYKWQFSPGSEISLAWKQSIHSSNKEIEKNFFNSINNIFGSTQFNTFSVKLMYYLDYKMIKKTFNSIKQQPVRI